MTQMLLTLGTKHIKNQFSMSPELHRQPLSFPQALPDGGVSKRRFLGAQVKAAPVPLPEHPLGHVAPKAWERAVPPRLCPHGFLDMLASPPSTVATGDASWLSLVLARCWNPGRAAPSFLHLCSRALQCVPQPSCVTVPRYLVSQRPRIFRSAPLRQNSRGLDKQMCPLFTQLDSLCL